MTRFESSAEVIPYNRERVYDKLADLSNLESIKDHLPQDKVKDMSFDTDTLSFNVDPVGQLTLRTIECKPCKCIRFETINSFLPLNMWIQIVSSADEEYKLKITIGLDINPFMKATIQRSLQEGLEKMADTLSMIQC